MTTRLSPSSTLEADDEKFAPIPIEEFLTERSFPFDVYIQLSSGRYLKILHAGDGLPKEKVIKFQQEKKLRFLFILVEERNKFISYGNRIVHSLSSSPDIKADFKMPLFKNVGEKIIEEIFFEGIDTKILSEAKDFSQSVLQMVQKQDNLNELLQSLILGNHHQYTHSFLTCMFSSMLAKQFSWGSNVVSENLAYASLLHDVGFLKLPQELLHKQPSQMTPPEVLSYQSHPAMAVELLAPFKESIPNMVSQIIMQHHESGDGTGFPQGLKHQNILILSRILFIVDEFVQLMVERNLDPMAAFIHLLQNTPSPQQRYGTQILENFSSIFQEPEQLDPLLKGKVGFLAKIKDKD